MQPITIHNSQPIGAEINSADARELHSFLNSERQYANWIQDRITQYGFIENQDFVIKITYTGRRPRKEYFVTLDMAKELCMVENNDKGKEARQYFIKCEKELQAIKFEAYVNKIAELDAVLIDKTKRHRREISGYKGKLTQANNKIVALRRDLTNAKEPKLDFDATTDYKAMWKNAKLERDYYFDKYKKLSEKNTQKENKCVKALDETQKRFEEIFTAIGAVKAYIFDNDEFFMKKHELPA